MKIKPNIAISFSSIFFVFWNILFLFLLVVALFHFYFIPILVLIFTLYISTGFYQTSVKEINDESIVFRMSSSISVVHFSFEEIIKIYYVEPLTAPSGVIIFEYLNKDAKHKRAEYWINSKSEIFTLFNSMPKELHSKVIKKTMYQLKLKYDIENEKFIKKH